MTYSLGEELPRPVASTELFDRLSSRRSASAQTLQSPGPAPAVLDSILALGARTPDHGKLFPWRFVVMGPESRHQIAKALRPLADRQPDPKKAAAVLGKLTAPPVSILVLSVPVAGHPVPVWEQELSAGAVCMNLEHAAAAFGFSTSWITDWYSYDTEAKALFGVREGERVAGFIHIGTVAEAPLERVRPDVAALTTHLP
ncbi:nitroreductase family protein [Brevundimonas variabilis]|uniref:Putative NAD(P)H nitroreductase n=1 Tax=Brevundimonas variabilis TaxID=74312 RepID=A0A7W9CH10_9CAUL|nr:nitroreductase [Brevundimonas variabilis]MBB5745429.1 nitroreductase [Brevundimonas variabilis]